MTQENTDVTQQQTKDKDKESQSEKMTAENGVEVEVATGKVQLKRTLGLAGGISFIVGSIVGSGIFVSPKGVLEATGSVGLSLTVWGGAGVISLLGSLCYCELGTMIPKAGGEYAYVQSAFGNLPAFLYTWVSIILIRPSSNAVKALTFATYLTSLFHYCGEPLLPLRLTAISCLVTIMIINCYSVEMAANIQIMTTIGKVLALVVIGVGGVYKMADGHTEEITKGYKGSTTDPSVIALAFYDALWAYNGWNSLNYVTEELKNPAKNLPRAIIISICLIIVIYLLANISYLSVMTKEELLNADAVAMLWGERVLMSVAIIIPLAVATSTFGSTNSSTFAGGRSAFSAARDGNLPEFLGYINVKRLTPLPSVVFTSLVAIVFVLLGDISSLIDFFSFTAWLFYGTTFMALLYFRVKRKDAVRPYRVPTVIPVIMVFVAAFLVIAPIFRNPAIEFLYAIVFIIGGAVFYFPFIYFKLRLPGMDILTTYSQLVLEIAPSSKFID